MSKLGYSFWMGVWKSVKNVAVVWGIPAVVLLVGEWQSWIPVEYHRTAAPIIGLIAYFTKNYIENKN